MATAQPLNVTSNASAFAFLAQPPPPRKGKVPTIPLPELPEAPASRRRSFSAIIAWASNVQPGSPASPGSPKSPASPGSPKSALQWTSLSLSKSETSPRRASIAISPLKDTPFVLSLNRLSSQKEPSPSTADFPVNLTSLGYTSVFVELPKTPTTPAGIKSKLVKSPTASAPTTPSRGKTMRRLRSISFLPSRSRSASTTTAPRPSNDGVTSPITSPTAVESPKILSAAVAMRKKATYTHIKPSKTIVPPPPSLAQDLAIMQFVGGGNMEETIRMAMQNRAQAAGNKQAVDDVHRDRKGRIWADREEELEYTHLLDKASKDENKWVTFGAGVKDEDGALALNSLASDRRDSATSQGSSLNPANLVKHADEDAVVSLPLKPRFARGLLNIPSRPNSDHLHGNASFFHLDLQNFHVPPSPNSPLSPHQRAALAAAEITAPTPSRTASPTGRKAGKPAPLTLKEDAKSAKRLPEIELEAEPVTGGILYFEMVRHEFLENSFKPDVPVDSSLVEESAKERVKEVLPRRTLRKSISMKFGGLLGKK